jgi:hypothetical protein
MMSRFAALAVEKTTFKVELVHPRTKAALILKDGPRAGEQAFIEVHS